MINMVMPALAMEGIFGFRRRRHDYGRYIQPLRGYFRRGAEMIPSVPFLAEAARVARGKKCEPGLQPPFKVKLTLEEMPRGWKRDQGQ